MHLGEFILNKRHKLGLSQKDLADVLLISIPTISKWEKGERLPDIYSIGMLATLLEVDLESLLRCEDKLNNDFDKKHTFDVKKFASNFRKLRKRNGYSLSKLSEVLGVTYQTISKWENEEALPSVQVLLKCSELFSVRVQELYYGQSLFEVKTNQKPGKSHIFSAILTGFSLICLASSVVFFLVPKGSDTSSESEPNPYLNKVSVTYDFDQFVNNVTFLIDKGSKVEKYNPNVEGYSVEYTYNEEPFDFDSLIYEDTIIKCDFIINKYNVCFYGQHDELLKQEIVEHGKDATPPDIVSNNQEYVFYGWDKDYTNVKCDLDISPIFKYNKADITFDPNGGECDVEYILDYSPSDFDSLPIPRLKGHEFIGWYLNGSLFTRDMEVYEPIILVAQYARNNYKVYLDPLDGELKETIHTITYGDRLNLPIPVLTNYDFIGWFNESTLIPNNYLYDFDHDLFLKAQYSQNNSKYSYKLVNNEALITSYTGDLSIITIPEILDGYPVVGLERNTFSNCKDNIDTIIFHKNIKTYEGVCFDLPNLKKIVVDHQNILYMSRLFDGVFNNSFSVVEYIGIGDIYNIGNYLENTSGKLFDIIFNLGEIDWEHWGNGNDYIQSLVLDYKIRNSNGTINWFNNLKSVEVRNIDNGTYIRECPKLESIIIPDGYETLSIARFCKNPQLTNFIVPSTVKIIESLCFSDTGLKEITIPKSVKIIQDNVFRDCNNLEAVYYDGTIEDYLNINFIGEYSNPIDLGARLYINGEEVTDPRIYS